MKKLLLCLVVLVFTFGANKDYNPKDEYECEKNDKVESCYRIFDYYDESYNNDKTNRLYKHDASRYKVKVCDLLHKEVMSLNTAQKYEKWIKNVTKNKNMSLYLRAGFYCGWAGDDYEREKIEYTLKDNLEKVKELYHKTCDLQYDCEKILSLYDKESKEYKKLWVKSKMVKGGDASFWIWEIPIF